MTYEVRNKEINSQCAELLVHPLYNVSMIAGERVWNTLSTHDAFWRALSVMDRM